LGLLQALRAVDVETITTQVGDRYVLEEMQRLGANLGGEQSGHLLLLDHSSTGDGLVSALQLLAVMRDTGQSLRQLSACMTKFPQVLVNVPVKEKRSFDAIPGLSARLAQIEASMNGSGRILLRYSGTELLARVMVEGLERGHIEGIADEVAGMLR